MYPERTDSGWLGRPEGFEPPTPRFVVSWSVTSPGFPLSPAMPYILVLQELWCIVVPAGARGFRSGGSSVVPCGGISTGGIGMPRITKRLVDGLKPGSREFFVWDEKHIGFGVRVQRSGVMSYV